MQKATPEDKQFSGHTAESIVAAMKMFNALGVKKKKREKKNIHHTTTFNSKYRRKDSVSICQLLKVVVAVLEMENVA